MPLDSREVARSDRVCGLPAPIYGGPGRDDDRPVTILSTILANGSVGTVEVVRSYGDVAVECP
jgi:hypothetical protein